jgi:hypothetical protein
MPHEREISMQKSVIFSGAVAAILALSAGCGGNTDDPTEHDAVDAGPVTVVDAGVTTTTEDAGTDAAANPFGNLLGLLGGGSSGGTTGAAGLGDLLALLGGGSSGGTGTGANGLAALFGGGSSGGTGTGANGLAGFFGGSSSGTGNGTGTGTGTGLSSIFGGGADGGATTFAGFPTCSTNDSCSKGQNCQQTSLGFGICVENNGGNGGSSGGSSSGSSTQDSGSGTVAIVDAGEPAAEDASAGGDATPQN